MSEYNSFKEQSLAVTAADFHRSACERKGEEHKCVGVITIKPGLCMFDCKLCGTLVLDTRPADNILDFLEEVRKDKYSES